MSSLLLNGSFANTALLQDDDGAFQTLLSGMLVPGTDPSVFGRDTPVAVSGVKTKLNVKVAKERAPVGMWVYQDQQAITYNRITLASLAAKYPPTIYADFPTTKKALFDSYLSKVGLFPRGDDITAGNVAAPGTVAMACKASSFLLTGSQNYTIKQAPKFLADVVKNTGLSLFNVTKDMSGVALTLMVAEVNAKNAATLPRPILATEVKAGVPRILNEYDGVNTEVELIGKNSEVYLDQVTLSYHRVNFSWYLGGTQMIIKGASKPTTTYLLSEIRRITGFTMEVDDIVPDDYATIPKGQTQTITVFIQPTSLRYVGEITIDYTAV